MTMSPSKASEEAVSRPPGGREGGREGGRVVPVDSRSVNEYKEGHGGREGGREEEKETPKEGTCHIQGVRRDKSTDSSSTCFDCSCGQDPRLDLFRELFELLGREGGREGGSVRGEGGRKGGREGWVHTLSFS